MIKSLILSLLLVGPVFADEAKKPAPPAPVPQKVPEAQKPPEVQLPLTQEEQLQIRLALAKAQEKALKKQLKDSKKTQSNEFNKTLTKIRKNHGWDDSVQLKDTGGQIVGVPKQ